MLSKTAVKYIQSLSVKKLRDQNKLFIAEGPKIVDEIINEFPQFIENVYALENYAINHTELLLKNKIEPIIIEETDLAKISSLKTPNQVLATLNQPLQAHFIKPIDNITIILEGISDPGNMGTIIRIADWFGIKQIVCSLDCVDIYNPKVVQSSMASIMRVNIIYADIIQLLSKNKDVKSYAAILNGKNIHNFLKPINGFLIIGNESKGLSENVLDHVSEKITIPRIGLAESLNAAVATGIILSLFKGQ